MPFNIETAQSQQYSNITLEPQVQNWEIPFITSIPYVQGYAYPNNLSIPVQIKDFFAEDTENVYTEFRIRAELEYKNSDGSPLSQNFAQITGPITPGQNYVLSENNLNVNIGINFQNLELLDPDDVGNLKQLEIILRTYGVRSSDGVEVPIGLIQGGTRSSFVNIHVIGDDQYYIEMQNNVENEFNHVIGEDLPDPLTVNVYGFGIFFLLIPKYFDVLPNNNLIGPLPLLSEEEWNGYRIDITAAPLAIQIQPNITIEDIDEEEFENDFAVLSSVIYAANWNPDDTFEKTIRVNLYKSSGAVFTPNVLEFFTVKNIQEAYQINLEIFLPGDWTFTCPDWMINPNPVGNGYQYFYNFYPIHSSNFEVGVYEGQCVLRSATGEEYIIPVKHTVVETVDAGFSEHQINFTRDNLLSSNIYHSHENMFCRIKTKVGGLSYSNGFYAAKEYMYKTGFFENKASIHIGEIVERNVARLTGQDVYNLLRNTFIMSNTFLQTVNSLNGHFAKINYYDPIPVNVKFSIESQTNSDFIFKEDYFSNIKYLRGRKPEKFRSNSAFLYPKERSIRITPKSKIILNALLAPMTYKFTVLVNGNQIYENNQMTQGKSTFGFLMKNLKVVEGDIVEVFLRKNYYFSVSNSLDFNANPLVFSQKYLVFPEGKHSNHIIYEDEYGLPQIFELTGDFSFESEYEFTEVENTEDLIRVIRNLESKKKQKFSINTGFIPKSNQIIIDEIIRSGTAWLIGNNTEVLVELRPVSKKMVNSNSDAETYAYDIEFEINPTHDLQVYS